MAMITTGVKAGLKHSVQMQNLNTAHLNGKSYTTSSVDLSGWKVSLSFDEVFKNTLTNTWYKTHTEATDLSLADAEQILKKCITKGKDVRIETLFVKKEGTVVYKITGGVTALSANDIIGYYATGMPVNSFRD